MFGLPKDTVGLFPWQDTGRWDVGNPGGSFYHRINLTTPLSPMHGSLECFPCDSVERPHSHLQQNYLLINEKFHNLAESAFQLHPSSSAFSAAGTRNFTVSRRLQAFPQYFALASLVILFLLPDIIPLANKPSLYTSSNSPMLGYLLAS